MNEQDQTLSVQELESEIEKEIGEPIQPARKQKRYEITKKKFLSPKELEHFQKVIKTATHFNRALLETLLFTGARAQEVLNLKWCDFDKDQRTLLIHGLKDSNDRELPIPATLFHLINKLPASSIDNRIFPVSYQRLYQIWTHHCPVRKGPHSARHTVGINLYKKTNNLNLVKLVLGHRSIVNTMIYSEYEFSNNELKKLIL
jgi:integrase